MPIFVRRITALALLLCSLHPLVGAEHQDAENKPPFYIKRIFLSDSASRVFLLHLPEKGPPFGVDNLPLLSTNEFAAYLRAFIGQVITQDSLGRLIQGITDYAHQHGQPLVNVSIPPQNIASGDVHVVVILGRFDLKRLIISDTEQKAGLYVPRPNDGMIVVEDDPTLATQEFARLMFPYFGHPITDESVNQLINDVDHYLEKRGEVLAHWSLPRQYVSTGALRIGITVGRFPLRHVVVAETPREAHNAIVTSHSPGAMPVNFPLFDTRDFRKLVARYEGTPISRQSVFKLRKDIEAYVKAHDRLSVSIPDPEVDLSTGDLRLSVVIARYGQVSFRGNRWFSDKNLLSSLGFHQGQEIRVSELEAAVNRTNQNQFRHVDVLLNGSTSTAAANGDVPIAVRESEVLPVRFSVSYDDTGNSVLGDNHYTGAVALGNLWGLDHQFSYQYTTSNSNKLYSSQYANYRAELPWHDYVVAAAAYTSYDSLYGANGVFHLRGDDVVLDERYVHPIFGDSWSLELSAGFDYKQLSSNLQYNRQEIPIFPPSVNSIAQITSSATYVQHDNTGSWVAGLSINGSPGGFNGRNTTTRFQGNVDVDPETGQEIGGPSAQARYIYGTATVQRLWQLPDDFQVMVRGQGQYSSARLLSSERMSIGGVATVRGYNERIESGDDGWQFTTEFRFPEWDVHIPFTPGQYRPLQNRFLLFWDNANVFVDHPNPNVDIPVHRLGSSGVGLRSNWASNFSLSADYGFELLSTGLLRQPRQSRGDIQVTLSY